MMSLFRIAGFETKRTLLQSTTPRGLHHYDKGPDLFVGLLNLVKLHSPKIFFCTGTGSSPSGQCKRFKIPFNNFRFNIRRDKFNVKSTRSVDSLVERTAGDLFYRTIYASGLLTCSRPIPNGTFDSLDGTVTKQNATSDCQSFKMENSEMTVCHDKGENYFYILIDVDSEKHRAKLEYAMITPNLVDLYHTFVPTELRGRGIAKILAKEAFDYFCEQKVAIRPSCTYLQKYLKDNPHTKYLDCIEKDFMKTLTEDS